MNLSEVFIRRPVFTILLNLTVLGAGLMTLSQIPIAALPRYDTPVISVSANLAGASPETMATSVALPLEKAFSTIAGIVSMSSSSTLGNTSITLEFDPKQDIDAAALDVQSALLSAQRALPADMTSPPSYRKVNPADAPVLLLAMTSAKESLTSLTSFAQNLLSPSLSAVGGVSQVVIYGPKRYAVRVFVKPYALQARGLTMNDVAASLRAASGVSPLGVLNGPSQSLVIAIEGRLRNASDFARLVIASSTVAGVTQPVYLKDVARVEDSIENTQSLGSFNGVPAIILAVQRQPSANTVAVVDGVLKSLPALQRQLPAGVEIHAINDRAKPVREALHDVNLTLYFTIALVVLVIAVFLRRLAATLIPALSLPISLLGTIAVLYWGGWSLDNISLLGLTLAVGLVVDDAIVMLENIVRYLEKGEKPLAAAIKGSREVAFSIVSISVSLIAILIPIFFMPGTIGLLFNEFAVTVGLAIAISAFMSLSLVPMLCARYLREASAAQHEKTKNSRFERGFTALVGAYQRSLAVSLRYRKTMLLGAAGMLALSVWLGASIPKGFFPEEDMGQFFASIEVPEESSFPVMAAVQSQVADLVRADPAVESVVSAASGGGGRLFVNLKPRNERPPIRAVIGRLQRQAGAIPGVRVFFRPIQNFQVGGRISNARYQFVLLSVNGDALLAAGTQLQKAMREETALFQDVNSDAKNNALQASLTIDREKAELFGISAEQIRSNLYTALGNKQASTVYTSADTYGVMIQIDEGFQQFEDVINYITVRAKNGALIPLSAIATVKRTVGLTAVNHQGQLQAVTLSFNLPPGAVLGQATQRLAELAATLDNSQGILTRLGGEAAAFADSQSQQWVLILAAVLVIYVLLGILYESFIHPFTILVGLPSAAVGGFLSLYVLGMEMTLIAMIGILLLIGIVKKNAILMIDFAITRQRDGLDPQSAIVEAAAVRFRPITMTTIAALAGALPLALGWGAGAELRQPLGVVVVGGLLFSQVVTLYITPAVYVTLDRFAGRGPITTPI